LYAIFSGGKGTSMKFTLFDTLLRTVRFFSEGKRRRAESLRRLADRKFSELEKTHKLFVALLHDLSKAGQAARERLAKSDNIDSIAASLVEAILAIQDAREKGIDARLKYFSEAEAYGRRPIEYTDILKMFDDSLAESFQQLMKAYTDYFAEDGEYLHALGAALTGEPTSMVIFWLKRGRLDLTKIDLENAAEKLEKVSASAIAVTRRRWRNIAKAYHSFKLALREYGFVE
jgi:hypothetical protein